MYLTVLLVTSSSVVLPESAGGEKQAQTFPDATPTHRKIPPFTKITVAFEPMKCFRCPSRFRIS